MIYLIGGPPRCGKSTVARLLAQRTGASRLLLDNLERVVCHYIQAGFARATDPNDWILGQDNWPVTLQRIAAMISHYSGIIRQQAEVDGATAISMDYAFGSQVEQAIAHLTAPAGP